MDEKKLIIISVKAENENTIDIVNQYLSETDEKVTMEEAIKLLSSEEKIKSLLPLYKVLCKKEGLL